MTSSDPLLSVPDDDALDAAAMAVADGVATPEEEAAVAAAPDGAARVAAQRAVARAVGTPPGEQDPDAAARARAAALAAFGASEGAEAESSPRDRSVASVVPMPPPRTKRTLPRLGAVAAALLLLVGIGTFAVALTRSGGSDDAATVAAAPPAKDSAEQAARSAAGQATEAAPTPTAPAFLNDTTAKPAQPTAGPVAGAVEGSGPPQAPAPPPPPAPVNGGDLGRQDDLEGVAQQARKALDGTPSALASAGDPALPSDVQTCVKAAATTAPETLGALRYRATGTFEGTPVFFLAFDRPTNVTPYYLITTARDGCSILGFTHF